MQGSDGFPQVAAAGQGVPHLLELFGSKDASEAGLLCGGAHVVDASQGQIWPQVQQEPCLPPLGMTPDHPVVVGRRRKGEGQRSSSGERGGGSKPLQDFGEL